MRTLLTLAFCGMMASTLHAEGLSSTGCPMETLAYYHDNFVSTNPNAPVDGPCSLGILNFSQFNFNSSGDGADLGLSNFELTPISPGLASQGDTGFTISNSDPNTQISVVPGDTATYVIDWYFAIDNGPIAGGASLGMDPPEGNATITAEYCVDSFITPLAEFGQVPDTCFGGPDETTPPLQSLSVTTADPDASIVFSDPAYEFADVRTIITLIGDNNQTAGFDGSSSDSDISPEPGTFFLIAGALLALAFLRRRALTQ